MGKISDYANVLKSKLTDLFVVYQRNDGELETKNATLEQLGDAICGEQVHATLETNDQTIIGGINELAKDKNIADEYDDTQTYDKGDVVIYKNTLYICNTNNTTGTWDATNWTATTIDNVIGSLSTLATTDKSSIVGAVNEVNGKIKTYNWISTSVAITTLYSGGSMYYCDITFPTGEATDCNEILALTMVDYGGLSNVLQFQIRGSRTFRIWSKTSMTLSTLTVKVLYSR